MGDALVVLEPILTNIETHVESDFGWAIADVELKAPANRDDLELRIQKFERFLLVVSKANGTLCFPMVFRGLLHTKE